MAETATAHAIIVDPRRIFCSVISDCLTKGGHAVVGQVQSLDATKQLANSTYTNLVIIGPHFAEQCLTVCQEIAAHQQTIKLIVFNKYASSPTFQADAIRVHASACLPPESNCDEWLATVAKVMVGQRCFSDEILYLAFHPPELTLREFDVLKLLADKKSDREIAKTLGIRFSTVRNHSQHILDKFNVCSRHEVIRRAHYLGML